MTDDDRIAAMTDAFSAQVNIAPASAEALWLVDVNDVGHAVLAPDGPLLAACGREMPTHQGVYLMDHRPDVVCEDCRRVVDGLPPRTKTGADPKREWQRRMF
jgi:hypothetical protein